MKRILFVCLGNICRSPLAEGILRYKAKNNDLNLIVDSCGTAGYHVNEMPDMRSVDIALKHNIDITELRGRKFEISDFENFDFIYVMDQNNYNDVIALATTPEQKHKVKRVLELTSHSYKNVPDPYYGGNDGFENVYNMLDEACDKIIAQLQ